MSSSTQDQVRVREQAAEGDQQRQMEADGVRSAHEAAEEIREDLMSVLTETDLSEGSKNILRNYASKEFILGYLQDPEVQELKWDLRIDHELYLAMHPGQECLVTGDDRAYINDDPDDRLEALSAEQKMQVATFFKGIWTNVTRARGMKQQEIMKTQIARSEVDRSEQDSGGGGILDRLPGV